MFQDGGPDSDHTTHEYSEYQKHIQIMIQVNTRQILKM